MTLLELIWPKMAAPRAGAARAVDYTTRAGHFNRRLPGRQNGSVTLAAGLIQSPERKRGVSPTRVQHQTTRSLALGALIGLCVLVGAPFRNPEPVVRRFCHAPPELGFVTAYAGMIDIACPSCGFCVRIFRFALKGRNRTALGNALGVDSVLCNASPERAG